MSISLAAQRFTDLGISKEDEIRREKSQRLQSSRIERGSYCSLNNGLPTWESTVKRELGGKVFNVSVLPEIITENQESRRLHILLAEQRFTDLGSHMETGIKSRNSQ